LKKNSENLNISENNIISVEEAAKRVAPKGLEGRK
jgi:hypothetical protein